MYDNTTQESDEDSYDTVHEILNKKEYSKNQYIVIWGGHDDGDDNVYLCKTEREMLERLFDFLYNNEDTVDMKKILGKSIIELAKCDTITIINEVLRIGSYLTKWDAYIVNVVEIKGEAKIYG